MRGANAVNLCLCVHVCTWGGVTMNMCGDGGNR